MPDAAANPSPLICPLPDAAATAALGARLATLIRPGDVLALWGDLGAGKTTLARGLIQALLAAQGDWEEVPSPTFTLVQTYSLPAFDIWHVDLYRIGTPDEILHLGLEEAMVDHVLLIEWPERMGSELPADRLDITLAGEAPRTARIALQGSWKERQADVRRAVMDDDQT